jgi:aryl-alcohol dehydrogenase-like predicted oxidoreductase
MRKIRFGRTNVDVPVISLGTWGHGGPNTSEGASVGWSGHDDNEAKAALIAGYRAGLTHWDTADTYGRGHAEKLIGEVLEMDVPRGEIFLATKVGWIKGPSGHPYDPEFMREQCEASLRNMGTDVIDLYYFHHCDFGPNDIYFDGALEMMRRLRGEGKIRYVGLSDWDSKKLMRFAERVDPDAVQPYRNVVDDEYESSGLRAYVDAHDLGVACFSPLMHGLLLGKYDAPHEFPEGDFRRNVPGFKDAEFIERVKRATAAIRERYADHPEPVPYALTNALLVDNPTACVLLGQRNPRQVAAAAAAGAGEPMTREEADWVRRLYRGV